MESLSSCLLFITPNTKEFFFQEPFLTGREAITYVKKKRKTPLVKNRNRSMNKGNAGLLRFHCDPIAGAATVEVQGAGGNLCRRRADEP